MDNTLQAAAPNRAAGQFSSRLLLATLLAGCGAAQLVGCVAENKNPQTVTEFLKMPRVGEAEN
jgi:hypothetical protein